MKLLTSACIASLLLSLPAIAEQSVSGLILSRDEDDGGMTLRNADGEVEIEIENIGICASPIVDEADLPAAG